MSWRVVATGAEVQYTRPPCHSTSSLSLAVWKCGPLTSSAVWRTACSTRCEKGCVAARQICGVGSPARALRRSVDSTAAALAPVVFLGMPGVALVNCPQLVTKNPGTDMNGYERLSSTLQHGQAHTTNSPEPSRQVNVHKRDCGHHRPRNDCTRGSLDGLQQVGQDQRMPWRDRESS